MAQVRSRYNSLISQLGAERARARHRSKSKAEHMYGVTKDILGKGLPDYAYLSNKSVTADALRALALGLSGAQASRDAERRDTQLSEDLQGMQQDAISANEQDRQEDMFRAQAQDDMQRNKIEGQQAMQRERMDFDKERFNRQLGWDQDKWGQREGLERDRMAQQSGIAGAKLGQAREYQNQMLDMKQKSLQAKMAEAARQRELNPFKDDPQAMSLWNKIPSAEDKNSFEDTYRSRGRGPAFGLLKNEQKPKFSAGGLGRLIPGNKEPSGKYSVNRDPYDDPSRVMGYDQFARAMIQDQGNVPEVILRRAYQKYVKKKGAGAREKALVASASSV